MTDHNYIIQIFRSNLAGLVVYAQRNAKFSGGRGPQPFTDRLAIISEIVVTARLASGLRPSCARRQNNVSGEESQNYGSG